MGNRQHIWSGLAIVALSSGASATTLDFEGLTRGSILTNQLQAQGILVSGVNNSGIGFDPGTVLNHTLGDVGVFDFGSSPDQSILYGIVNDLLRVDFVNGSDPTTVGNVSFRAGDGDSASESFRVTFYDAGGGVLQTTDFTTFGGPVDGGVTVTYAGNGVAAFEVLGIGTGSGGAIDDLSFETVPEPATMAALGVGALGLIRRKRSRKA